MIPDDKIEEVRERADIVEVIGEHVELKRKGRNHMGCCPFHSEKSPSFSVNSEKRIFHCFGCHESGNVVTFLMKYSNMTFPDAVRSLAKRYGVTIVEERGRGSGEREALFEASKVASEYFYKALRGPAGKGAMRYLKDRGYEGEIVDRFRLGFAPESWNGLTDYLKSKGISCEVGEKIGVLTRKEKESHGSTHFDKFRGRLIFPITDTSGRVIAFGGRILGDGEPKYLNSPETPLFVKGRTLFAFYQARQEMSKARKGIIVEGYFDLLALHNKGFRNSVATMGTALTPEHIRSLKSYTDMVYTLFDGDEAGKKAATRSLEFFIDEELPCRVIALPEGKDPDDLLLGEGGEALERAIAAAIPLMEFKLHELKRVYDITTPEGKGSYLNESVRYLKRFKNAAEMGHYVQMVARDLSIKDEHVYGALKGGRVSVGEREDPRIAEARENESKIRGDGAGGNNLGTLTERTIIGVLLHHPELATGDLDDVLDLFTSEGLKKIGKSITLSKKKGDSFDGSKLIEGMDGGSLRDFIAGLLVRGDDGFLESPEDMLSDSIKSLKGRGGAGERTRALIRRLEAEGRHEGVVELKEKLRREGKEI